MSLPAVEGKHKRFFFFFGYSDQFRFEDYYELLHNHKLTFSFEDVLDTAKVRSSRISVKPYLFEEYMK